MKGTIDYKTTPPTYYDCCGNIIHSGDSIKWDDEYLDSSYRGRIDKVGCNEDGYLGTDATNRRQIELGMKVPFECGIYLFSVDDMKYVTKVN